MSGRVAVVTGGGSGMGHAAVLRLARQGHAVAVLDLDGDAAERVAEQARAERVEAVAIMVDVADRDAVLAAFDKVRAELGPVAVLVTSAGLSRFDDTTTMTPEVWHHVINVNLSGTFWCCQAALPDMQEARWGRIITIASSSAQRGSPRMAHYAAAKGGVISLTRSLAREQAKFGITVNTIPPSAIETPMQHAQQARGELPSNEVMASHVPLGHLGEPDDIAATVAFLASDDAKFLTGQVIGVNGGAVM